MLLALVKHIKEDFVEGRKAYDEAIKMQPNSGLARLRIAKLMVKEAKIDPALAYLKEATVSFPMEPLMHIGLGDLRVQIAQTVSDGYQEHFNQAEEHYRRALRIDQGSLSARRGLLTTLIANEKPKRHSLRLSASSSVPIFTVCWISRVNQLRKQYDVRSPMPKRSTRSCVDHEIYRVDGIRSRRQRKTRASFKQVITLSRKTSLRCTILG